VSNFPTVASLQIVANTFEDRIPHGSGKPQRKLAGRTAVAEQRSPGRAQERRHLRYQRVHKSRAPDRSEARSRAEVHPPGQHQVQIIVMAAAAVKWIALLSRWRFVRLPPT
jgi:hypothetical protein